MDKAFTLSSLGPDMTVIGGKMQPMDKVFPLGPMGTDMTVIGRQT
jgi:hypothetical protein